MEQSGENTVEKAATENTPPVLNGNVSQPTGGGNMWGGVLGGLVVGLLAGVAGTMLLNGQANKVAPASAAFGPSSAVFELDGKVYKLGDLPASLVSNFVQQSQSDFDQKKGMFGQVAAIMKLSKVAGKPFDDKTLESIESLVKVDVSEQEAKEFYKQLVDSKRIPEGTSFESVQKQIEAALKNKKVGETIKKTQEDLEKSKSFKLLIPAPEARQVALSLDGYPAVGPASAKVVLAEVADYTCPHCREVKEDVEAAKEKFKDKVRFVHVDFSLNPATYSGTLARGAYCARKQGDAKYWAFHEKAFKANVLQPDAASPEETAKSFNTGATSLAKDAGLDEAAFSACLNSEEAQKAIQDNNEKVSAQGIHGTPTFILNGRMLSLTPGQLVGALEEALAQR